MEKITLSVSDLSYQTKPEKKEFIKMTFAQKNVSVLELSKLIATGYAFTHIYDTPNSTFNIKEKVYANFIGANLIALDYDNSPFTFDCVLNKVLIKPTIAYTTYSNSTGKNRYRLLYVCDKIIQSVEEYRNIATLLNENIFTDDDFEQQKVAFDKSCSSAVQLFLGTNLENQQLVYTDCVIKIPLNNGSIEFTCISNEYTPIIKTDCCPKNKYQFQLNIPTYDLNMNYSFGTPINNSIYPVNPFNNFFTADISDKNMIYHYVGEQNIYSLSTFMKNGKVAVGKRHNTMKYHMFVIRNMYPNISISEMVSKVRWLVNSYYTNPFEITDEEIYRMSASVLKMGIKTETGKRKYILNPDYKYLSKSEKIKSFQKCKSQHTKEKIGRAHV